MTLRSICLTLLVALSSAGTHAEYLPKAEPVVDKVYAIVGPLGQRSRDNDGLNANYGFVVTPKGVILVDSGASRLGAEKIEHAIRAVTDQPVRWVINTGSQDHRWLGNDHFASRGAEVIALRRTAATQAQNAAQQMHGLERFLGDRVDRILGVMPESSVAKGRKAFRAMAALAPAHVVPGHGRVCDLARAKRDTGDYYDFLADTIGAAAKEMEPMDEMLKRHADAPAFRHLENFDSLHRANMNRAFTEFEAQ